MTQLDKAGAVYIAARRVTGDNLLQTHANERTADEQPVTGCRTFNPFPALPPPRKFSSVYD